MQLGMYLYRTAQSKVLHLELICSVFMKSQLGYEYR